MTFLPERCSFLAKKSLLYAGTFGFGAWLCGLVFIDRSNPQKAKQTLKDAIDRIHREKVSILQMYVETLRGLKVLNRIYV